MPIREQASEIEDVATGWAAKAERGLTSEERTELDQWLEGDSRRLGAFVRAQAAWIHSERAAALGKMPDTAPAASIEADPIETPSSRTINRRMLLGGGGAIAASVVAVGFIDWPRYRQFESGVGEIRHIALAGGTTLTLDTDSRVDVAMSSKDRTLKLKRGKMFLDVVRHEEGPVAVSVANVVLTTEAGAFSLQSLATDPVVALVTRGGVDASQSDGIFGDRRQLALDQDQELTLGPREKLSIRAVRQVAAAQREQLLAWRDGMLSFGGEPLAQAVRSFDRYGPTRIVVVDPELAVQRVTGLFSGNDPRGFANAIAASLGAVVNSQGDTLQITPKKVPTA